MMQAMAAGIGTAGRAQVHRLPAPGSGGVTLGLLERRGGSETSRQPPVLVVHGATLGAGLFDLPVAGYSMLSDLAEAGRSAFAIDIRGYGLSLNGEVMDARPDANPPFAPMADAVRDISAAVDFIRMRENAEAVDILGSSWGTITAARYAGEYPQNVARLVLYAPLYAEKNNAWLDRIADPGDRSRLNPRFGAYRLLTLDELARRWNADLGVGDPASYRNPGMAEAIFAALSASDPRARSLDPPALRVPNGALADLVSVFNGRPLYDPAKLTMPTLLVRGADDTTATDSDARNLFARIASGDKEYRVVSPGSHFLCVERSRRQLYKEIERFLEVAGRSSPGDGTKR
jgi:pimeloyl-ACP methyl ester carboxylesterase